MVRWSSLDHHMVRKILFLPLGVVSSVVNLSNCQLLGFLALRKKSGEYHQSALENLHTLFVGLNLHLNFDLLKLLCDCDQTVVHSKILFHQTIAASTYYLAGLVGVQNIADQIMLDGSNFRIEKFKIIFSRTKTLNTLKYHSWIHTTQVNWILSRVLAV